MKNWKEHLAACWPTDNPAEILLTSAGLGLCLAPKFGVIPATADELLALYRIDPHLANLICLGLCGVSAPVVLAKWREQWKGISAIVGTSRRYRGIWMGESWIREEDFWTHLLVTGMTGSGKSSTVILPAAKQLLDIYNHEDLDPLSRNPFKKIGMFVLEVKGTFFEYLVYLVHEAGRNAAHDVVLFRPDSRIPMAHFVDEQGRSWYLNGFPHTWKDKVQSSEAHNLFSRHKRKTGEFYPPTLFTLSQENAPLWDEIRDITVDVTPDIQFLGWRWEGPNELVRVSQTLRRSDPDFLEVNGKPVKVEAPKTLKFVDVQFYSSGLKTNLVKKNLPPSEAASRLKILTKLAEGGDGGGDKQNDFFYKAAEKQIQSIIALHRYVNVARNSECTVIDIVRLTTDSALLETYLTTIENKARALKAELDKLEDEVTKRARSDRDYQPMIDLLGYFNNEWKKHQQGEGKVANSVNSVITNAFGRFLSDPSLRETYCSPQTIDYRLIYNEGQILCFVPGKEYETMQKMLAVDSKMDFVSMGLARKALGLDMIRPVCHLTDEVQEYIISHDTVGDNKALSQLREFRVFYFAGTQSDAWVDVTIGNSASKVYRQSFAVRVYLRNTDEDSNRRASKMCGTVKVEDRQVRQRMSLHGMMTKDGEFHGKQDVQMKDRPYIREEDFGFLPTGEGVVWYAGGKTREEQRRRTKFDFSYCTSEAGHAAVRDRVRHYFREVAGNTLVRQGQGFRINHDHAKRPAEPKPAQSTPAAPQHTPLATPSKDGLPPKFNSTTPLATVAPVKTATPITPDWQQPPATPEAGKPATPPVAASAPQAVLPTQTPRPTTLPVDGSTSSAPSGLTKRALAEQSGAFRKHVSVLDSLLDQMEFPSVVNAKIFHAEMKDRLQSKHRSDHELAAAISGREAAGQTGATLGSSEIAAQAAPVPTAPAKISAIELETLASAEQQRKESLQMAADLMTRGATDTENIPEGPVTFESLSSVQV